MSNPLAKRPWLLVIAAFLALIAAWGATFSLTRKLDTRSLSGDEELRVLAAKKKAETKQPQNHD